MNKRIRVRRSKQSKRLITARNVDELSVKQHRMECLGYEKTGDVGFSQVTSEYYQWYEKEIAKELP
jgi:hypothetical protein